MVPPSGGNVIEVGTSRPVAAFAPDRMRQSCADQVIPSKFSLGAAWHGDKVSDMKPARLLLLAAATAMLGSLSAAAQGQRLEACSRGNVQVCHELLARPRLDAGRRAAIEFHLAELERLLGVCLAGDAQACSNLLDNYPELPPALRPDKIPPAPKGN